MWMFSVLQGEIDAHEDSFRATDEAGQALLAAGHYASEEVKEKVGGPCWVWVLWRWSVRFKRVLCAAGDPGPREGVSAGAVGAAPAAVRAMHGPAALLQGHGAGGQLDEQAGGKPARCPAQTEPLERVY